MKHLIYIIVFLLIATDGFSNEGIIKTTDRIIYNKVKTNVQMNYFIENSLTPRYFKVKQNYPNPFYTSTIIEYELSERANTVLKIYNIYGELITTLDSSLKEAGSYSIEWDGTDSKQNYVSSGVYFYVLVAGTNYSIHKMTLLN